MTSTTKYISQENPYNETYGRLLHPVVTVDPSELKAYIWQLFQEWETRTMATIVRDVTEALVPVGYKCGFDTHKILIEMVSDGVLMHWRIGGYPAYKLVKS